MLPDYAKHTPSTPSLLCTVRREPPASTPAGPVQDLATTTTTMPSRSSPSMAPPLLHRHHDLQGPRPAPLKANSTGTGTGTTTTGTDLLQGVNKRRRLHQQQAPPPRQPVIIYVESPRVVHAHPGEFKSVVQRLTGAPAPLPPMVFPAPAPVSSAPPPPALPLQFPFQFPLVGAAGSAGALLPLTSSVMSVTVADTTGGGGGSPVHQQLANHHLLVSRDDHLLPLPPSSLAGVLFVDHRH